MRHEAKVSRYYSSLISENSAGQRKPFSIIDRLLHHKSKQHYPEASLTNELVNSFAEFFYNKIMLIRKMLTDRPISLTFTQ